MPSLVSRLLSAIHPPSSVPHSTTASLAVTESDSTFYPGGLSINYRDRYDYDRQAVLAECLRAWRINPLARRIVKLITQFVIGSGLTIKSDHKATQAFLSNWWHADLNNFNEQIPEWMDEVTRAGNIFALATVDPLTGMTYWRAVPADQITEIQTKENDIRQETHYIPADLNAPPWPAYDPQIKQNEFILHYSVNRPIGTLWGEPDLAPLLPWIGRFSAWLEDRARLNRFRFSWLIVWKKKWSSEAEKTAKQRELNAHPPSPGSFLLLDEDETVTMPSPELNSMEANADGLALKKMIAAGIGLPLHYLSEPESSTRTTAEAAGTPTFRALEQSQTSFLRFIDRIAQTAVTIRKQTDKRVNPESQITAIGPDITERDNALLSLAVARIYPQLADLFDRNGIDEDELLRLFYRMAGEAYDQNVHAPGMLKRPLKATEPPRAPTGPEPGEEPKEE